MGRKTRKVRIKGVTLFDNPADYDLEIKKSKIHGVGLFTKKAIKKGRTIAPYNHKKKHVMKWDAFKKKYGEDFRYTYSLKRVGKIINMKKNRNLVTFVNDATPKENSYLKRRRLIAKRDIKAGEEITLSYPHYQPKKKSKRRRTKKKGRK